MAIGEICSREVIFVEKSDSVATAAKLLREHHIGSLVVVDRRDGKKVPAGMLTDRDIAIGVVALDLNPVTCIAGDVMSPGVTCIREDAGIAEAVALMQKNGMRRLPVVDASGSLVGLIASDDLIELLAEEMSGLAGMISSAQRREKQLRRSPTL